MKRRTAAVLSGMVLCTITPAAGASVTPATALHRYQVVQADVLMQSTYTHGTVSCPTGTRSLGGGALPLEQHTEDLVSSRPLPDGTGWEAWVWQDQAEITAFRIYVICAKKPAEYHVVNGAAVTGAAGTHTFATVACPTGTVPLGGGGGPTAIATRSLLAASIPQKRGWRVDVNVASPSGVSASVVCATKPSRYVQVYSTAQLWRSPVITVLQVRCPDGTKAYGGGGSTGSSYSLTNLNATSPASAGPADGWDTRVSNWSDQVYTAFDYAVCGRAAAGT